MPCSLGKATLKKDTEAGAWLCMFGLRDFILLLNLGMFVARPTEPCLPLCSAGKLLYVQALLIWLR